MDFIVDVVDKPPNFVLPKDFYKFIIANENKEIDLVLYNILSKEFRRVKILLTRNWEGADFLLGFKVRFEDISLAQKNMYRVLDVIN